MMASVVVYTALATPILLRDIRRPRLTTLTVQGTRAGVMQPQCLQLLTLGRAPLQMH